MTAQWVGDTSIIDRYVPDGSSSTSTSRPKRTGWHALNWVMNFSLLQLPTAEIQRPLLDADLSLWKALAYIS